MKLLAWIALLPLINPTPEIRYFRYQRPIQNLTRASTQACLPIPAELFAHAAPNLADLRLYSDRPNRATETPYVVHSTTPASTSDGTPKTIHPLNLGQRNGQIVFDAEFPDSPATSYSDVQLDIAAHDFIANVTVSGSPDLSKQAQSGLAATSLGTFTVFDLTGQKLGRSTILHLPRSNFSYLHFRINGPLKPESVTGLSVDHSPSSQPKYQSVAQSTRLTSRNHASIIEFTLPANVPFDRIVFVPGPPPINFSRQVDIDIAPASPASDHDDGAGSADHISSGNILRIHTTQNGHPIDEEHLAIELPGTQSAGVAHITITVNNGDDQPLDLQSVQLQMLERSLCFEANPGNSYTLYYGDPVLEAPQYDYASLFTPQANAIQLSAGLEIVNDRYKTRADTRPFAEKHPALLWAALIAVVALLGAIALRSSKTPIS